MFCLKSCVFRFYEECFLFLLSNVINFVNSSNIENIYNNKIYNWIVVSLIIGESQMYRGPFITALGRIWCPEHFVCVNGSCRRPLQDIGFVEEKGNYGGIFGCLHFWILIENNNDFHLFVLKQRGSILRILFREVPRSSMWQMFREDQGIVGFTFQKSYTFTLY